MKNQELARKFGLIADALELKGETGFRVLAYRKAARALSDLGADIETLDAEGRLEEVPGIGAGIAKKIHEYLSTGRMAKYEEAVGGLPSGLFELLEVQGLGPKTAKLLYEKLGVTNPTDLKQAIEHGRVTELPGMGDKKVANLRRGLEAAQKAQERMLLDEAFALAAAALERLQGCRFVRKSAYGGSLRRGCETVGDIDLLVTGSRPKEIVKRFTSHPGVRQVLGAGETKASVLMESSKGNEPPVGANSPVGEVSQPRQMQNRGPESSPPVPSPVGADSHPRCGLRQVDLRVVAGPEYGAALQYFTGSKDHNVALRALAQKQGLKLSEYGLFRGERQVAGRTEEEVYSALGLAYIEPELRENRGELEAAQADRLPRLVTQGQIKSDLHVHTSASDGAAGLEEMAESCRLQGYTHLAIADHSVSAGYAGGQGEDALLRHCDRVDRFNSQSRRLKILKSCEVDIRTNGDLDYADRVLKRLDLVIAAIHQGFQKDATKRTCSALTHPLVHMVAHPSGRMIGRREGYDIDLEQVIECAAQYRKILEINAFYGRLDLNDVWARRAGQAGVRLAVNTDAHAVGDLDWMRYGVITARRAWLTRNDVVNCLTYPRLLSLLGAITGAG